MTRKERIDWLCRLRSNIYYMPNKWHEKMECALSEAIDREENDIIERVLEIIDELKSDNIGRDGSDEYTSACQDFRAAVMELKGGVE